MPQVIMPQLGETVTEGTVSKWLKKVGDAVKKYEPLLDVETDKVASEIPSPFAGVVTKIIAEEGATVPVGSPVCEIEETGGAKPASGAEAVAPVAAALAQPTSAAGPVAAGPVAAALAQPTSAAATGDSAGDGARHSPAVRKLAREHGVDLRGVSGTGRGGRVTANDVLAAAKSTVLPARAGDVASERSSAPSRAGDVAPERSSVPPRAQLAESVKSTAPAADDTFIKLTPIRKTIAERMALSRSTIPFAWSLIEVDVTDVAKWREREKHAFKAREGVNLTYVPIVVYAVCAGLKEVPVVNSEWAGDRVIVRKHINVGIAVDTEEGLVVPVVRDADRLSIAGLAAAISGLVDKARHRKLTMDDLSHGTFTVNNTGAIGSVVSVPIINPPQAAIFAMEAVVKRPWVVGDAIAIRSIMNISLCFDHRVFDGGTASQFLQAVKRRLEAPPPALA